MGDPGVPRVRARWQIGAVPPKARTKRWAEFSTHPQHPLDFIPYIPKFVNLNFMRLFVALVDCIFVFGQKTAQGSTRATTNVCQISPHGRGRDHAYAVFHAEWREPGHSGQSISTRGISCRRAARPRPAQHAGSRQRRPPFERRVSRSPSARSFRPDTVLGATRRSMAECVADGACATKYGTFKQAQGPFPGLCVSGGG